MSPEEAKQVEESIALAEAIARRKAFNEAEKVCRDEVELLEKAGRSTLQSVRLAYRDRMNTANYCADAIAALKEKP